MKAPRKHPRILSAGQVQAILEACHAGPVAVRGAARHRDADRGGAGLRHEDWAAAERTVAVTPRSNDNGARVMSGQPRTIPTSPRLVRLYADYLPVPRLVIRHAAIVDAK